MPMDVSFSVKKQFLENKRLSKTQLQDRGVFRMIRILLWEGYCGKNGVNRGIHAAKNQTDADELMRKLVDSIDLDYE